MSGSVEEVSVKTRQPMVMPPGLLTPLPWPDWSARFRSLDVDGVRVDYVEVGPHRLDVPAQQDRPGGPVRMMLTVVLSGSTAGEVDGHPVSVTAKQAVLIDGRAASSFQAAEPMQLVRIFVDEDHLPAEVLAGLELPFAHLKDSPLIAGCVGFITGLLQVGNPPVLPVDEIAVSQPLIALLASLLNEALHRDHPPLPEGSALESSTAATRRQQIETHIEQHLADRELSVSSIAAALGVTARTVHLAFEDSTDTVAAVIRSRRLARAQAMLALRQEPPLMASIAARVGLTRDQLNRTFRSSTGHTTKSWWEHHHHAADLPAARTPDRAGPSARDRSWNTTGPEAGVN